MSNKIISGRLKGLLVFIGAFICIGFWAFTDYHWGNYKIRKTEMTLVSAKTDWTFYKPWTWIKQPITQLLWLNEAFPLPYDENYYIVHIYYYRYGEEGFDTFDIVDLNINMFAGIEKEKLKELLPENLPKLNWLKAEGCIFDLVNYLKSHKGKIITINSGIQK